MTANKQSHLNRIRDLNHLGPAESQKRYHSEFGRENLSPHRYSVFPIDQSSLRPVNARASHWSIAWSDLMMTMFILFLSLFVYQATHKDFLISDENNEIKGAYTKDALQVEHNNRVSFPFMVIKPAAPLITSGSIKKIESITMQDIDLESTFSTKGIAKTLDEIESEVPKIPVDSEKSIHDITEQPVLSSLAGAGTDNEIAAAPTTVLEPKPIGYEPDDEASVNTLFTKSRLTLDSNNLNEFASIDLIPDKTMRIVLTGDLLFQTGKAVLSLHAQTSLEKIAAAIRDTPYQIHVEGHTDNIPIISDRYTNNWELSLARANAVTTFLIENMQMNPGQFVISGYSSYRPVLPNITAKNRAANRRVEIVVTRTEQEPIKITANSTI